MGCRMERASRHPCRMLNPWQMGVGGKEEVEVGLCELRESGIFHLKVIGWQELFWGGRLRAMEVWGKSLYLHHTKHAKVFQEEHP